ncbi:MAG: hypothetical protein ABFE07_13555 [Armatimonadia bacterium]
MPNTLINFYRADTHALVASVTTDSNGLYNRFLTGPLQYHAVTGAKYCTPNPMNVTAGAATINLVKTTTTYP